MFGTILETNNTVLKQTGTNSYPNSPSIDRFDSNKGYTKDNIRIVSAKANALKSDGTLEEFLQIIKYIQRR